MNKVSRSSILVVRSIEVKKCADRIVCAGFNRCSQLAQKSLRALNVKVKNLSSYKFYSQAWMGYAHTSLQHLRQRGLKVRAYWSLTPAPLRWRGVSLVIIFK
jgi:hypothetical protein